MSRLLMETTIIVAQTTPKWSRVALPVKESYRSYSMRPSPPPEKKWLYKQVLESVRSGIAPQFNLTNSTLGQATSQMMVHLNVVHQRAQDVAVEYGVKEKIGSVLKILAGFVGAVKDFIVLKQYYQLDRMIDKSLLALEEKIRATRQDQLTVEGNQHIQSPSRSSSVNFRKMSTRNCTTIMLNRDPCVSEVNRVKDFRPRAPAVMIDKSQQVTP